MTRWAAFLVCSSFFLVSQIAGCNGGSSKPELKWCSVTIANNTGVAMRVLIHTLDLSPLPVFDNSEIDAGHSAEFIVSFSAEVKVTYGTWDVRRDQWGADGRFLLYHGTPTHGENLALTATWAE